MSSLTPLRSLVEASKDRSEGIAPETVLRLIQTLEEIEPELLLLRDIVADLDELLDGDEGPLFQEGHTCRVQRRMAQFYREIYKPNAEARGHRRPGKTYGRGVG